MKTKLAEMLVCPICRGSLVVDGKHREQEEIRSGALECPGCRRSFEIVDGIPRFLLGRELPKTRKALEAQWRFRFAGKFEKKGTLYFQDYEELVRWWFSQCLGDRGSGQWMLDAGCGTGEKAMAAARDNPALEIIAMDMADTIALSAREARHLPNLHFVQGDVLHPPFRAESFAKVVSWGVLHSTRSTEDAFRSVARLVAPHGRMLVWIYPHPDEDEVIARYYKIRESHFFGLGHRLPPSLLLWLVRLYCIVMSPVFLLWYKREAVPKYRSCRYMSVGRSGPLEQFKSLVFIVYDTLAPEYVFRHRRSEIIGWYGDNGFTEVETDNLGHYWGERSGTAAAK